MSIPANPSSPSRVAALLTQQEDFPTGDRRPERCGQSESEDAEPYLQLAFIYAKYLRKTDQAVDYVNRAIALDPADIEAYQRLYEIELCCRRRTESADRIGSRRKKSTADDPAYLDAARKTLRRLVLFKPD